MLIFKYSIASQSWIKVESTSIFVERIEQYSHLKFRNIHIFVIYPLFALIIYTLYRMSRWIGKFKYKSYSPIITEYVTFPFLKNEKCFGTLAVVIFAIFARIKFREYSCRSLIFIHNAFPSKKVSIFDNPLNLV